MPAKFNGTPGLTTVYEKGGQYSNGEYRYRAKFTLATSDDVQAVEVRFLAFDVWGEHMQSFRYEEVADIATGAAKPVTGEWRLFSENDAEKFYASIGYVSRVRLKSGRVVTAQDAPVVEEARKFSSKFSAKISSRQSRRGPGARVAGWILLGAFTSAQRVTLL